MGFAVTDHSVYQIRAKQIKCLWGENANRMRIKNWLNGNTKILGEISHLPRTMKTDLCLGHTHSFAALLYNCKVRDRHNDWFRVAGESSRYSWPKKTRPNLPFLQHKQKSCAAFLAQTSQHIIVFAQNPQSLTLNSIENTTRFSIKSNNMRK